MWAARAWRAGAAGAALRGGAGARGGSAAAAAAAPAPPAGGSHAALPPRPPLRRQLVALGVRAGVPMIGFGVMDNIIMLTAGQQIEMGIGAMLGLSTLAAAGLGQIVSDVSGVFSGGAVDALASRLKLQPHGLSQRQLTLPAARWARLFGQAGGIALGCTLGLSCLFFIDADQVERERRLEELNQMFDFVESSHLETVERVIGAELAVLWIHDKEEGRLLARVMSKEGDKDQYDGWLDWSMEKVEQSMETGQPVALFARGGFRGSGREGGTRGTEGKEEPNIGVEGGDGRVPAPLLYSTCIVPVLSEEGPTMQVHGAVQLFNKRARASGKVGGELWERAGWKPFVAFSPQDQAMMRVLCAHIHAFFTKVREASEK